MSGATEDARILDRGYRRYEGPRTGARGPVRSVAVQTARRMLGLRRSFRWKVVPIAVLVVAYGPVAVFIGFAAFLPARLIVEVLPSVADAYAATALAMSLFAYVTAPQALCPDRRHRTLGLYLSAPLTRDTYLAGKFVAVAGVLLVVTLGPPVALTVGYASLDVGVDVPLTLLRAVVAGVVLSVTYALIGTAAASLTDRVAFAAAGTVLGATLLGVAARALEAAGASPAVRLISVAAVPLEAVQRLFGEAGGMPEVSTGAVALAAAGWTVALGALVRTRYRRLEVTR